MTDPYIRLEDTESAETKSFYEKWNKRTSDYFIDSQVDYFTEQLEKIGDADVRGMSRKYDSYTFWIERKKDWQKPKLVYALNNDDAQVLLDFELGEESLDFWYPSDNGELVLYGTSTLGNEQTTIHIIETKSRNTLSDNIPFAGFTDQGDICWLDDKSFIYPRMNGFMQKGPEDRWLLGTKLYKHTIGDLPENDQLIYGKDLPDTVMLIPTLSSDRKHLYVAICEDELTHRVIRVQLDTMGEKELTMTSKSVCCVKTAPGLVYVLTNYQAERYRLMVCNEHKWNSSLDEWDEILPETDDVLQDFWINQSGDIIALYSHKVSSRLRVFDKYGNQTASINMPKLSVVYGVSCSPKNKEVYYTLSSFTTPSSIYKIGSPGDEPELIWQRVSAPGDSEIQYEQFWAVSKDGTRIPYFAVCRRDVQENAPCIVYGYGGFNISLEPSYLSASRPWVVAGGVYVLANLRGGSEFGESWHRNGALEYKQKTFDDCIAIANDLVKRKITSYEKLGVLGGSNGGLLVAAVTVQQPDLFRAGAALVPLTDMLEFYKHQVAEFWVHEYGDPRIPEQRKWIEAWSPYHFPIRPKLNYPALYYETALHDARVHPLHALKMVARLDGQVKNWKGSLLLRTLTDTGHQSSNKTKREIARQTAEYYAFFARELGLDIL